MKLIFALGIIFSDQYGKTMETIRSWYEMSRLWTDHPGYRDNYLIEKGTLKRIL
ncbi:hypothetical protein LCGC14_1984300 [marine sediment metagenome]|uniref:Uncharacterized protein n=1 Tax=marine sediment metagenome TaxID=412755 RepID=A0A0F9HL69_9ZZZZ